MGLFDQEFSRREFLKMLGIGAGASVLSACTPPGVLQPEINRSNLSELLDPEAVTRSSDLRMLSADLGAFEPMPVDLTPEMLTSSKIAIFTITPEQALAANMSNFDTKIPYLQLTQGAHAGKFLPIGAFKEEMLLEPLSRDFQEASLKQNQAMRLIFADSEVGVAVRPSDLNGSFRVQTQQGHVLIDSQFNAHLRIVESRPDITKPINNGRIAVQVTMPDGKVYYTFTSKGVVPDINPQTGEPLHYALRHGNELGQNFPELFKNNIDTAKSLQEFGTNKPGQTLRPLMIIDTAGQNTIVAEIKVNGQTHGVALLVEKTNGELNWFHGFEMNASQSKRLGVSTPRGWNEAMTLVRQYANVGSNKQTLQSIRYLDETGQVRIIDYADFCNTPDSVLFNIWKKSGSKIPAQLPQSLRRLTSKISGLNMLLPLTDLAPLLDGNDLASTLEETMARLAPDTLTYKDGNRAEINLDTLFSTRGTDYGRILVNDGGLVAVRTDMDPTCPLAFAALPLDNGRLGVSVKILNSASSVKEYAAGTPAEPLDAIDRTPASYLPEEMYVMMPWEAADGYIMSESEYQQHIQAFLENGEVQPFPIHEVYNRYMDTNGLVEDARYLITPIHFADGTNKLFIYNQRKAKLVA